MLIWLAKVTLFFDTAKKKTAYFKQKHAVFVFGALPP